MYRKRRKKPPTAQNRIEAEIRRRIGKKEQKHKKNAPLMSGSDEKGEDNRTHFLSIV
jgi:hypothetical protein